MLQTGNPISFSITIEKKEVERCCLLCNSKNCVDFGKQYRQHLPPRTSRPIASIGAGREREFLWISFISFPQTTPCTGYPSCLFFSYISCILYQSIGYPTKRSLTLNLTKGTVMDRFCSNTKIL